MTAREEWKNSLLGEVLTLKRGYDLPRQARREGTIPVVSSSGITGFHEQAKVKGPGVVTGRYGTLGEVFFIRGDFWPLNTSLYVQDFKGSHPRFISYFLKTLRFSNQNVAGAVPGVNRNYLHALRVRVPPLPAQRKIAAILSAYDDLIENNTRRIAILEGMARMLYQEWFVEFRFPGYENVPMVDSPVGPVPQGWRATKLGDVLELAYGKALRADDRLEGSVPVFGSSGVVGYHNASLVDGPGIIVGRKGHVGSVHWSDDDFCPIDTVFFVHTDVCLPYVYFNLQTQNFVNNDAAVPGLNRNQAYLLPFLLPDGVTLEGFQTFLSPLFRQIRNLRTKNDGAGRTRDLLLPKLVSGELDVEALDIDIGELNA